MNPFRQFGRIPWKGDQPNARPLRTQDSTTRARTHIHTSSGIQTQDPSVRPI